MGIRSARAVPNELRIMAEHVEPFDRSAAAAYRRAADLLEQRLAEPDADEEVLDIASAAAEWGWNPEALRRRIAEDPLLNAGRPGAPRVTRSTMERLGRGRGPRPRKRQAAGESSELHKTARQALDHAAVNPAFAQILARATMRRAS